MKLLIFLVFGVLVAFPRLDRLAVSLPRYLDANALIDPEAEALKPWLEEFEALKDPMWSQARLAKEVERFTYKKLPYEWDWNLWGNADYFPTVAEAVARGKEDCDGRAVVAASMLRAQGIDASLLCDFVHVWLKTDVEEAGELMGPRNAVAVIGGDKGFSVVDLVSQLGVGMGYSVSVFPLWREILLIVFLWWLVSRGPLRRRRHGTWLLVMLLGLMFFREGGQAGNVKVVIGLGLLLVGIIGTALEHDGKPSPT